MLLVLTIGFGPEASYLLSGLSSLVENIEALVIMPRSPVHASKKLYHKDGKDRTEIESASPTFILAHLAFSLAFNLGFSADKGYQKWAVEK